MMNRLSRCTFCLATPLVISLLNPAASAGQTAANTWRITTASGTRLRQAPRSASAELTRLSIGTVVEELERSPGKDAIGGSEDYWYRVRTASVEGWIFGAFTMPLDKARAAEAYASIAEKKLKAEDAPFADLADLAGFLGRVINEVSKSEERAGLELTLLIAIKRAAAAVPPDKQNEPTFQSWIKAHSEQLVYSEPSAQWLVKSDLFWQLRTKYGSLPIAETIAWEAARNSLPGECEGFLECHLAGFNMTYGKYLRLYPQGHNSGDALDILMETVQATLKPDGGYQIGDKADLRKALAEARATVEKVSGPKATAVLRQMDQLERRDN